jgi:hypothetical protein
VQEDWWLGPGAEEGTGDTDEELDALLDMLGGDEGSDGEHGGNYAAPAANSATARPPNEPSSSDDAEQATVAAALLAHGSVPGGNSSVDSGRWASTWRNHAPGSTGTADADLRPSSLLPPVVPKNETSVMVRHVSQRSNDKDMLLGLFSADEGGADIHSK